MKLPRAWLGDPVFSYPGGVDHAAYDRPRGVVALGEGSILVVHDVAKRRRVAYLETDQPRHPLVRLADGHLLLADAASVSFWHALDGKKLVERACQGTSRT